MLRYLRRLHSDNRGSGEGGLLGCLLLILLLWPIVDMIGLAVMGMILHVADCVSK